MIYANACRHNFGIVIVKAVKHVVMHASLALYQPPTVLFVILLTSDIFHQINASAILVIMMTDLMVFVYNATFNA